MIRMPSFSPFRLRSRFRARAGSRLVVASAVSGLLILVALAGFRTDQTDVAPAPAPAPKAVTADAGVAVATEGARSYSYYPEQLAALHSMKNFTPIADEGQKMESPAAPTVAAGKAAPSGAPLGAPLPPRIVRRADSGLKVAALQPANASPAPAAPSASRDDPSKPKAKLFGILPGLPDLGQSVKGARDVATSWGAAAAGLGAKIVGLWH
jgi:hypothetical protein